MSANNQSTLPDTPHQYLPLCAATLKYSLLQTVFPVLGVLQTVFLVLGVLRTVFPVLGVLLVSLVLFCLCTFTVQVMCRLLPTPGTVEQLVG